MKPIIAPVDRALLREELTPRRKAEDAVCLCPFPTGGRRTLGFIQHHGLTAAEVQESRQLVGVGVARQPCRAAAHIQRQRRPGEEAARPAFAEE